MRKKYHEVSHAADMALKVFASNELELFENAAFALSDIMVKREEMPVTGRRTIDISGVDKHALFVEWLNELLYLFHVEKEVILEARVELSAECELHALCKVGSVDPGKKVPGRSIKAATYHGIKISREKGSYELAVVLDI